MEFAFGAEVEKFRQEVRDFIKQELRNEVVEELESGMGAGPYTREFWGKLGARGWLASNLPKEYGGLGGTHWQRFVLTDELSYYRGMPDLMIAVQIVAPTLLLYGSEEQKQYFLPRIARGEIQVALNYTEPNAGSDLASIETRAVEDGDGFVVNGQKCFSSFTHYCEYGWLLARTDPTAPKKYQGVSLFIVDLNTPGITLRPVWIMDGVRTNEVFYDDVRISKKCLVGEKNRGFYYLTTALNFERVYPLGWTKRIFDELVEYVRESGKGKDPLVRQSIAQLAAELQAIYLLSYRVVWMMEAGQVPMIEGPVLKTYWSEFTQRLAKFGWRTMGLYGQIYGGLFGQPYGKLQEPGSKWAPLQGRIEWLTRYSPRRTIGGGTVEIMRNTIAQRGLGLPR
ncbi:acyl-CoA dehydrogenase family protein [Chloroflexota bacterium]